MALLFAPAILAVTDEHREDELKDISLSASGNVGALMLAICGTFLIRGTTFIRLWMGPASAELSGRVLNILSVGVIFGGAVAVMWAVMFGISKHKALVPIYLFEALANLALSIVLVRKIGVTGAAWGTTIPSLIVCLLYWPRYIRKILHIPVRAYFLATWGRPALALVPFALTTYAFERFSQPSNVYIFFQPTAITLTPAFVGFWFVCLSETQRQSYLSSFRKSLIF
jgi:O-antigen/teichoic acid export membrane protein